MATKAAKKSKPSKAKKKAEPTAPPERQLRFKAPPELIEGLQWLEREARAYWARMPELSTEDRAAFDRAMAGEIYGRPKRRQAPRTLKAWLVRTVSRYPHEPGESMTTYSERLRRVHEIARKTNPRLRPTKSVSIAARLYGLRLGPRKRP